MAIADKYSVHGKPIDGYAVGLSYDSGHWFAMGEWGHTTMETFLGQKIGWYAGGGYRFGAFTPYLTYAQVDFGARGNSDPGLTLTGLPPAMVGFGAGLNAGLNSLLQKSRPKQNTLSMGARWDFAKNFDVKLQVDHMRPGATSFGTLINIQPGLRPGSTVNLLSVSVDFLF